MDLLNLETVSSDQGSSTAIDTQLDNLETVLCHAQDQNGNASVEEDDVNAPQRTLSETEQNINQDQDTSIPEDAPLVDFSDEQTIQVPPALLMTAEMDDTFGIFNKQNKPKCYSTPNTLPNRLKLSTKSSSTTSWDSPSFLASINLNDGFLKPSTSDFTVWANNQPPEAENLKDSLEDIQEANTEHQAVVKDSEASGRKGSHEPINSDDKTSVPSLDDNSTNISQITRLEGSSEHEDKTSDNDNVFEETTDSDILDVENLSVFTADEADISGFTLMKDSNIKRMHIDFTETNEEENVEPQIGRSPKTPSPSILIRTPSGRVRNQQRPLAPELDAASSTSPSLQAAITCPEYSEPTITLATGTEESHVTAASSSTPPAPVTPTTQRSSRALSTSALEESPMKHSPFPTLESILKKVDDMFSNIDYVDPELMKQRKERERLASLPAVIPQPVERKLKRNKKTNASLDSAAVNECVHSASVVSTSTILDIDALNQTQTVNKVVPTPDPVSTPESANAPESVNTPEPVNAPEPIKSSEPFNAPEPVNTPDPVTPERNNHDEIGTPFQTPTSNKYKPTPSGTPLTTNSSRGGRSRVMAPIPRLSFSSSSSSGSDSCKRLSVAKPVVIVPKPASKGPVVLSARGTGSELSASLKINAQKLKPTLQPMKATMAMPISTSTVTTAPAPRTRPVVCASAPVSRKFIPPIAASSPKPGITATTSARGTILSPQRRSLSVKSSGYGQQSSLNLSKTSLNGSRTSLNTSIPLAAPTPSSSTQIPARVSMPSPKARVPASRTMPSPRVIPVPRAMPSPIRTRISSLQLPGNTNGTAAQQSVSMEDIPDKITEPNTAVSEASKALPVSKNKENKPKLLQRFGFRK